MKFNPKIHHRRNIRLKGYDYSQSGAYFITICCQDMMSRFGKIENGEMILNEFGQIAFDEWMKLSERYANFELDVFQIMPNRLHGIVVVGAGLAPAQFPQLRQQLGEFPMEFPVNIILSENENDDNIINPENEAKIIGLENDQNIISLRKDEKIISSVKVMDVIRSGHDMNVINSGNDAGIIRAGASPAPTTTIGDMMGAYKSLVFTECLKIFKSRNEMMGKF